MINDFSLSASEFIEILNERMSTGADTILTVTGNSMVPFLVHKRDRVVLRKFLRNAKKGDILFYKRNDNKCVLHRVIKTDKDGIYFIGDAQDYVEGPVPYENILAECREVIRKGKTVNERSCIWWFFKYIWLNIVPVRLSIIRFISEYKINQ